MLILVEPRHDDVLVSAGGESHERILCWHPLARRGVRVNALHGPVATPALGDLFADDPDKVARRNVYMPMVRFGTAEEVAATVAYLASDDAGYVTASAFPLDGGISAADTTPTV